MDQILCCKKHGNTRHFQRPDNKSFRCRKCATDAVIRRRAKVKQILVNELGGKCFNCGYNKYIGALHFHHLNPETKEFAISAKGFTRSLISLRKEAQKCIVLCANCHAELQHSVS